MHKAKIRSESVGAVIVIYHPDLVQLRRLVQRLVELRVGAVVLVNNGDARFTAAEFWLGMPQGGSRLQVLNQGENIGVARALNLGVRHVEELGCTLCWSFDQDSVPNAGALSLLLEEAATQQNVAAVAPGVFQVGGKKPLPFLLTDPMGTVCAKTLCSSEEVAAAITSGFLFRIDAWKAVGGALEPLFIDHVDTEVCFRLRSAGWRILAVPSARMEHQLGSPGPRLGFLLGPAVTLRPPARTYHMLRNGWLLGRMPHIPPGWGKYQRLQAVKIIIVALLHGPSRRHQVAAVFRAWRDAKQPYEGMR